MSSVMVARRLLLKILRNVHPVAKENAETEDTKKSTHEHLKKRNSKALRRKQRKL